VDSLLLAALPVTASLTLGGAGAVGAASAWRGSRLGAAPRRPGRPGADRAGPGEHGAAPFILGLLLILLFCVYLQWLPFPTYVGITQDPAAWAQALILPWTTLALLQAATYARLTRTSVLETSTRTTSAPRAPTD